MGTSETMPNPTNWVQFYEHRQPQRVSDATVVTTTVVSAPDHHRGPVDGRVSKPIRRRSRVSRRTPTTVLNTDTTNFRAMVQQFTGSPIAPSQETYLGFSSNQQIVHPTTANSGTYGNQFQQALSLPCMGSSVQGRARSSPSNENNSENNFMF